MGLFFLPNVLRSLLGHMQKERPQIPQRSRQPGSGRGGVSAESQFIGLDQYKVWLGQGEYGNRDIRLKITDAPAKTPKLAL